MRGRCNRLGLLWIKCRYVMYRGRSANPLERPVGLVLEALDLVGRRTFAPRSRKRCFNALSVIASRTLSLFEFIDRNLQTVLRLRA